MYENKEIIETWIKKKNEYKIDREKTPVPCKAYDLNEQLINKVKCPISGRTNLGSLGSDLMSV